MRVPNQRPLVQSRINPVAENGANSISLNLPTATWEGTPSNRSETEGLTRDQRQAVNEARLVWQRLALHLARDTRLTTPCTLGVTSTIKGEGKTTSSICIAAALASETEKPVLL